MNDWRNVAAGDHGEWAATIQRVGSEFGSYWAITLHPDGQQHRVFDHWVRRTRWMARMKAYRAIGKANRGAYDRSTETIR